MQKENNFINIKKEKIKKERAANKLPELKYNEKASLELNVKLVKPDQMHGILQEYDNFIEIVRKNIEIHGYPLEAFRISIEDVVKKGILIDYLNKKESEVIEMLKEEFKLEDFIEVRVQEGIEEGREAGREEGREEGIFLAKRIFKLDANGVQARDIAIQLNLDEDFVKKILS